MGIPKPNFGKIDFTKKTPAQVAQEDQSMDATEFKDKIVNALNTHTPPTEKSLEYLTEAIKTGISHIMLSINESSLTTNELNKQIIFLNWVLVILTFIIAGTAIITLFKGEWHFIFHYLHYLLSHASISINPSGFR